MAMPRSPPKRFCNIRVRSREGKATLEWKRNWLLAAATLALLAGGCGKASKLVPADGSVMLDDRPVEEAGIAFHPSGGGQMAAAVTDPQGRFELMTVNDSGAVPGEYKVAISKFHRNITMEGKPLPNLPPVTWGVPRKYANPETSA